MKICRVIFSANRFEFLIPTLQSHEQFVNFGDNEVYSIFIDDYPMRRYDNAIIDTAKKYGFNEVVLHPNNKGITLTWSELWEYLSTQDFDFIWHHEDDVVFTQPINIQLLIDFLQNNPKVCQICLQRNPWYDYELNQPLIEESDIILNDNFRYNLKDEHFWTLASLYPHWLTKEPIKETLGCNLGEYPVMKYFKDRYNMKMAILKNHDGTQIVEHIGIWSQGTRVLENEPGWEKFKYFDSMKRYDSKTGKLY
jgi:hypothetical protein